MLTIAFFIIYSIGVLTCFNKARLGWIASKNGITTSYFSILASFAMGTLGILAFIHAAYEAGVI